MNYISCLFPGTVGNFPFFEKNASVREIIEREVKYWWKDLPSVAREFYRSYGDMFAAKVDFYRHFGIDRIRRILLETVLKEDSEITLGGYNRDLPKLLRETWSGIIKGNPVLTDKNIPEDVRQKILIRIWNNHLAIQVMAKDMRDSVKGIASDLVAKEIEKMIES